MTAISQFANTQWTNPYYDMGGPYNQPSVAFEDSGNFEPQDYVSLNQYQPYPEVSAKNMRELFRFQGEAKASSDSNAEAQFNRDRIGASANAKGEGKASITMTDATGTFESSLEGGYNGTAGAGAEIDIKNRKVRAYIQAQGELYAETKNTINVTDNVSVFDNHRLSLGGDVKLDLSSQAKFDKDGIEAGNSVDAIAKAELKHAQQTGIKLGDTTFSRESEQKLYADAHAIANSKLVVNKDEFTVGANVDIGAEAGVGAKETLKAESKSGSVFSLSGEANAGAGGSGKGGITFSRKNADDKANGQGSTEINLNLGGKFMAGASAELKVKIADADIDTALGAAVPFGPLLKAVGGGEVLKGGLKAIPTVINAVSQTGLDAVTPKTESAPKR